MAPVISLAELDKTIPTPEPQKRHIARRGLKQSLNKEKLGQCFYGWRAALAGKRLSKPEAHHNAWRAFQKKRRIGL